MFSHKIDKLQGIIFTRASGTPTTVTMIDHIQSVLNDPDFDPKYNSIIVLEENTHIAGVPTEKIETHSTRLGRVCTAKKRAQLGSCRSQ